MTRHRTQGTRCGQGSHLRPIGLLGVAFAVMIALVPTTASAVFIDGPNDGMPGLLSLRTDPAPLRFADINTGDIEYGQIQIALDDADSTGVWLDADLTGSLVDRPGGLRLEAAVCDVEWTGIPEEAASDMSPVCVTGGRHLLALAGDSASPVGKMWDVGSLDRGQSRYVLVTLRLPEADTQGSPEASSQEAEFTFRVEAYGDDPVRAEAAGDTGAPGSSSLALTGAEASGLLLVATVFVLAGMLTLTATSRRRRSLRRNT